MQTQLYTEDWIGLRSLDEAGRVQYVSVPGNHLGISRGDMKKYVVPYLEEQKTGTHDWVGDGESAEVPLRQRLSSSLKSFISDLLELTEEKPLAAY